MSTTQRPTAQHEIVLDAVVNGIEALHLPTTYEQKLTICYGLGQLATSIGSDEIKLHAIDELPNGKPRAIGYAKVGAISCKEADAFLAQQEFTTFAAVHTVAGDRNPYALASDAVEVYSHFPASGILHAMAQKYSTGNRLTLTKLNLSAARYYDPVAIHHTESETESYDLQAATLMRNYEQNGNPDFVDAAVKTALIELASDGKFSSDTKFAVAKLCTALMDLDRPQEAVEFLKAALQNDTYHQLDHDAEIPLRKTMYLPVSEALKNTNPKTKAAELAKIYDMLAKKQQQAGIGLPLIPLPQELHDAHTALLNYKNPLPKKRWQQTLNRMRIK